MKKYADKSLGPNCPEHWPQCSEKTLVHVGASMCLLFVGGYWPDVAWLQLKPLDRSVQALEIVARQARPFKLSSNDLGDEDDPIQKNLLTIYSILTLECHTSLKLTITGDQLKLGLAGTGWRNP